MPISYGQIAGFKFDTPQPIYDPNNPKPTLYPPKAREVVRRDRVKTHGNSGYDRGCRCDYCKKAHSERTKRYREQAKLHGKAKCAKCGRFKAKNQEEFPNIASSDTRKRYICAECLKATRV